MKKIYQYQYDNLLQNIKNLEDELAKIRLYKGDVAIHQGDNWHDNPVLYQTELKESALMAKISELRSELYSYEVIKERSSDMISLDKIINPTFNFFENISDEIKEDIELKYKYIINFPINKNIYVHSAEVCNFSDLIYHRIAYLICSLDKKISPKDILFLHSEKVAAADIKNELSKYITDDVEQYTLLELLNNYLSEKLSFGKNSDGDIEKLKISEEYKEAIDKFVKLYFEDGIVEEDFRIDDQIVFSKEEIRQSLFNNNKNCPNFEWSQMYFAKRFKEECDSIYYKLNKKYSDIYKALPSGDPIRKEAISDSYNLEQLIKKKGIKLLKDYFKKLNRKTSEVYKIFINNLHLFINSKDDIERLKINTTKLLNKKNITKYDIPALIYLNYCLNNRLIDYKHIFYNDELLSDFLIYTFGLISNNAGISIFSEDSKSNYEFEDFDEMEISYNGKNLIKSKK